MDIYLTESVGSVEIYFLYEISSREKNWGFPKMFIEDILLLLRMTFEKIFVCSQDN